MSQVFWTTVKHWLELATTVGGVATFYPTDDGTPTGNALFSVIYPGGCQATAEANTALFTAIPACALKSISADRKTVTFNVAVGTVLGILGATMLAAPDGTKVHCHIMGN